MFRKPLTKRQQYWRDHLMAATESGDSFPDYANAHQLNIKSLYGWRTRLKALGHLPTVDKATSPGFVRVAAADTSSPMHKVSVILPNGLRLELQVTLDRHLLRELMAVGVDA